MSSNSYLKVSTMQYPLHQGDIRLMYPDMGEEFVIPDADIVEVEDTPVPSIGVNEYLVENVPVLIDGKWTRQFEVRQLTAEEIEARDEFMAMMNPKPPVQEATP